MNYVDPSGLNLEFASSECAELFAIISRYAPTTIEEFAAWSPRCVRGVGGGGGEIGGGGGGALAQVPTQNNTPQQNDCQRFADIVDQMAKSLNVHLAGPDDLSGTVQRFMDQLAIRFTELPGASYFNAARALVGNTNERFNPREFGSEGFARPYYEPPIGNTPSNQVRHAVGGLLAGYVRGRDAGLRFMNSREDPNDPLHGVPDINLNNQTVPMGAMIRGPVGYSYAAHLGNWIMETLCAHAR